MKMIIYKISKFFILFQLLIFGFLILLYFNGIYLGFNFTPSLPYRLWISYEDPKPIYKLNEYIRFTPPLEVGYYDNSKGDFIKQIAGIAGDKITINNKRQVFINDKLMGKALIKSSNCKTLKIIQPQTIKKGFVFVHGTHSKSYDSRYKNMGLIAINRIHAHVFPIVKSFKFRENWYGLHHIRGKCY